MGKQEFVNRLDGVFQDTSALFIYFVVKQGNQHVVKKANVSNDNSSDILQNLISSYSKRKAWLDEIDHDIYEIDSAMDASEGILLFNLEEKPKTFGLLREVSEHQGMDDDYFGINGEHFFGGKDNLKDISGFIFQIGTSEHGYAFVYRQSYAVNLYKRTNAFIFDDGKFEHFKKEILSIDGSIDYLMIDAEYYIFNNSVLEKNDDVKIILQNAAASYLQSINNLGVVSEMDGLKQRISEDPTFARKVISAVKTSPVTSMKKQDIITFVQKRDGLKGLVGDDGNSFVLDSKKKQNDFIKLLNDDFLQSALSKKDYDAMKKKLLN